MASGGGNNNAQVYEQQQAAQEARQKEEARAARLQQGQTAIDQLFEGAPVMGTRAKQMGWDGSFTPEGFTKKSVKKANPSAAPSITGGAPAASAPTADSPYFWTNADPGDGYGGFYGTGGPDAQGYDRPSATPAAAQGGGSIYGATSQLWGPGADSVMSEDILVGPDGREYRKGDLIDGTESYDTGARSGGFGDDFYNKFRQSQLDYYLPDVDRQFGKAKEQLTYDLARAGTSQSSIAGDQLADLIYQNQNNVASVNAKADASTADLRKRVAADKSAAISQLYATEDPTMAANEALSRVRTIQDVSPELNPLGDIFKIAAIGGGNFASTYNDPYRNLNLRSPSASAGRTVG